MQYLKQLKRMQTIYIQYINIFISRIWFYLTYKSCYTINTNDLIMCKTIICVE